MHREYSLNYYILFVGYFTFLFCRYFCIYCTHWAYIFATPDPSRMHKIRALVAIQIFPITKTITRATLPPDDFRREKFEKIKQVEKRDRSIVVHRLIDRIDRTISNRRECFERILINFIRPEYQTIRTFSSVSNYSVRRILASKSLPLSSRQRRVIRV